MKNSVRYNSNDIYLTKVNQYSIGHEPGIRHTGYTNPEKHEYNESRHTYVVDWQIPKGAQMIKS
jgi:hypothetical protein